MRRTILLCTLAVAAGCSGGTTWVKPGLSAADNEREYTIDHGYCTAVAHGAVQVPSVNLASSPPSYQINGTVNNQYGQRVGTWQASANPSTSFGNGFAKGLQIGNQMRAQQAQEDVYQGCMASKGWTRVKKR